MSDSLEEAITILELEVEKAKARVHIKDKCLRVAMGTLRCYAACAYDSSIARNTLDLIEEMLGV